MMQAKIKRAWLDALRSGNYEQGRQALRIPDGTAGEVGYCCLGVLLDVSINEGFLPELNLAWSDDNYDNYEVANQVEYYDAHRDERDMAPADGEWEDHDDGYQQTDGQLGAFLCDAFGISGAIESNLVNKNDTEMKDFLAIADYIEEVL